MIVLVTLLSSSSLAVLRLVAFVTRNRIVFHNFDIDLLVESVYKCSHTEESIKTLLLGHLNMVSGEKT